MAIPDYQTLMLPLLQITADGKEHSLKEAIDILSKQFDLQERLKEVSVAGHFLKEQARLIEKISQFTDIKLSFTWAWYPP